MRQALASEPGYGVRTAVPCGGVGLRTSLHCRADLSALIMLCPRVVGGRGIGGFKHTSAEGSALGIKRWLLRHEGVVH